MLSLLDNYDCFAYHRTVHGFLWHLLPSEKERSELFTNGAKELSPVEKTRLRSDDDLTQWKEDIG